tara:strand:- start:126 stop:335 length:210 start_codon:yes stop_codon:yes gene_type:complete
MEKKTQTLGLELKEAYVNLDSLYMKGTIWSKKGSHENYEIVVSAGDLIEWMNKIKLIDQHKIYIKSITD